MQFHQSILMVAIALAATVIAIPAPAPDLAKAGSSAAADKAVLEAAANQPSNAADGTITISNSQGSCQVAQGKQVCEDTSGATFE